MTALAGNLAVGNVIGGPYEPEEIPDVIEIDYCIRCVDCRAKNGGSVELQAIEKHGEDFNLVCVCGTKLVTHYDVVDAVFETRGR